MTAYVWMTSWTAARRPAGVHSGDIVVGLGEQEVRDWQSFMPMLKEHKPGETVKLRVRRHETYLDLDMTLGRRNGEKG